MTSDWMTGDDPHGDADWAWFTEAYGQVPEPRPEAVARATQAMQASVTTWHAVRLALRWILGTTTAVGVAVGGYTLVKAVGARPSVVNESGRPAAALTPTAPESPKGTASAPAPAPSKPRTPARTPAPAPAPERRPMEAPPQSPPMPEQQPVPEQQSEIPPAHPEPMPAPDPLAATGFSAAEIDQLHMALGDSAMHELSAMVSDATDAGLPAISLLERAQLSVMHGEPPSAVLQSVARRRDALRDAAHAIGMRVAPEYLFFGADAIEGGVTIPQLADVGHRVTTQGRSVVGLLVLAKLVQIGVPAADAVAALTQSLDARVSDSTLFGASEAVAADVMRGGAPVTALRSHFSLRTGQTPDSSSAPANGDDKAP